MQSSCVSNLDEKINTALDLWYQERHNNEVSFGLHIKNVLYSQQSKYQRVDVLESSAFGRILTLDGLMMTSERDEFVYHEMIAHVPMLAHQKPERVLIIGGGDGGTLREVLRHECLKEVVLCEIDADVIDVSKKFFPCFAQAFSHPKATVLIDDGVEFVKNSSNAAFDIVIVDSADPIGPGIGLFSEAFYAQVRRILKAQGIVVAQCESPWENKFDLTKVYGNLKSAFTKVYAMIGSIPSYPYGCWSWGFASDSIHPYRDIALERAEKIQKLTNYYNIDLHRSAFSLPNFFKRKLSGIINT